MDITKASVHDIGFLNDIKHGTINNCTLLADNGYLSDPYQIDLFNSVQIKLETPMRSNQKGFKPYPYVFEKTRKRIETIYSQLTDQFMVKRNYAKTFIGLTLLQNINIMKNKPINNIKHTLAFQPLNGLLLQIV